jgi:hypothetical protein
MYFATLEEDTAEIFIGFVEDVARECRRILQRYLQIFDNEANFSRVRAEFSVS